MDIFCSEIEVGEIGMVAIKPHHIDKADGASTRQIHFHSAGVLGVPLHPRRTVHHLTAFHIVDELVMGTASASVGISKTKRGRYAIQCFSGLPSFRISCVVKRVDSMIMAYESYCP